MAARSLANQARALLQDAVAPDLWETANAHTGNLDGAGGSGSSSGSSGGWGGGMATAPAPGPEFGAAANATGDGSSMSAYLATPDRVVIILGVTAILLTLAAIGLRLYRSEHGCCCSCTVAQPTAGPAAVLARSLAKPLRPQAPPVIVVMPNEELLCAVKDGARSPVTGSKQDVRTAREDSAAAGGSSLAADAQSGRRQQQRDAGHVPACAGARSREGGRSTRAAADHRAMPGARWAARHLVQAPGPAPEPGCTGCAAPSPLGSLPPAAAAAHGGSGPGLNYGVLVGLLVALVAVVAWGAYRLVRCRGWCGCSAASADDGGSGTSGPSTAKSGAADAPPPVRLGLLFALPRALEATGLVLGENVAVERNNVVVLPQEVPLSPHEALNLTAMAVLANAGRSKPHLQADQTTVGRVYTSVVRKGIWDSPGRPVAGMHPVLAATLPAVSRGEEPPSSPFGLLARRSELAANRCAMTVANVEALRDGASRGRLSDVFAAAEMATSQLSAAALHHVVGTCVRACCGEEEWQRMLLADPEKPGTIRLVLGLWHIHGLDASGRHCVAARELHLVLPKPSSDMLILLSDPDVLYSTNPLIGVQCGEADVLKRRLKWEPPRLVGKGERPPLPAYAASDPAQRGSADPASKGQKGGQVGNNGTAAVRPKAALATLRKAG
ncbi:hypothetical protein C2E21_9414 [Chlorella sorokiniana]|uniref:Uncharacterized protein n=1 Tax=Chlorella sorokiniana TaxID=3076 RepID=A0A2P6TBL1_CHLSO|nr:hypothetical protein C2E21_9414 [Chlorella sorokiniana]|eukprot:PRW05943.1 hypothetical protein C2E21_9414 [Chlorella sorokiniana]